MPVEKKVFRFEVSVYNIVAMKVVESECDFGGVELGHRVGESLATG